MSRNPHVEREPADRWMRPSLVAVATVVGLIVALAFASFWRWINLTAVWRVDVVTSVPFNLIVLAVPVALWAFAPTNRAIARFLDRVRTPRPMTRRVATLAIALASAAAFYGLAVAQGRATVPLWHDSNMHMVQAQLIAHGRLWAEPHALADHMETFQSS